MYKKFLFLTSFVLVLTLAYSSYGATDGYAPKPDPESWRFVPVATGPNTIYMKATPAIDVNNPPAKYYFECTTDATKSSGWVSDANYTATGLTPGTTYSFRVRACDDNGGDPNTQNRWSLVTPAATTDLDTTPPVLKLDFNYDPNNDDANTQVSFTKFIKTDTGSDVCGVIIDIEGNVESKREEDPCGAMEMYDKFFGSVVPDPCWYSPKAGERIYRDYVFAFGSGEDTGLTITLYGLGVDRDCNITMWAYDSVSTSEVNRVANWYANGEHIFDTNFIGGVSGYPKYDNQNNPPPEGWLDLYKYAWSGKATSDKFGRIILTSQRDPNGEDDEPFSFVNALRVEPNNLSQTFIPTPYAHRPVPFDGTEDVLVNTELKWRNGDGVVTHQLYLGTNSSDVNDANTVYQGPGVLIYASSATNPYDPYGATGFLALDTTYYWRVDEVNAAPATYKGEVWSLTTGPNSLVDNFYTAYGASYPDRLRDTWKDYWTQDPPYTGATVYPVTDPNHGGLLEPNDQSMRYLYENQYDPYYSEARADLGTGTGKLNIDPNWLGMNAKSLVLWFYGTATNDANQQMYVKVTDGDNPANTGKVDYPYMSEIREEEWHEWNIDLALLDACGVDLTNVAQVTIGFGDGTPAEDDSIEDVVFFDDIQLYTTRCALVERSDYFANLDFAPGGEFPGDCVIDYQEIDTIGRDWLNMDLVIATKKPDDTNLVVYYPLNEGDGNRVFSHPDEDYPDSCDTKWTGTFWNSGDTPPGYYGTTWGGPGAPVSGANCVYLSGEQSGRVQCGATFGDLGLGIGGGKTGLTSCAGDVNAITLSIWCKWLGPRTWDRYLDSKCQGLLGKRGGWDDVSMVWMLEVDTNGSEGGVGLRHYVTSTGDIQDVFSASGIMLQYINQWIHVVAVFPTPADDPEEDPNAHARVYINGGEVADGPWRFSNGDDPNIFLTIGETMDQNAWVDSPESWYGYLDEVRIYNRVLEVNEIGYLADVDPEDGELWVAISSPANVYDGNEISPYQGEQPKGQRAVNFKDFAVVVKEWLTEEMFPPSHRQ